MKVVNRKVLEQVIAATTEPLIVVRIDRPDWPVVLANPAFVSMMSTEVLQQPFADVIEELTDRELALEVSEIVRSQQEASLPVESNGREYLLVLRPLSLPNEDSARFYGAFWRSGAGVGTAENAEVHHAQTSQRVAPFGLPMRGRKERLQLDTRLAARAESAVSQLTGESQS